MFQNIMIGLLLINVAVIYWRLEAVKEQLKHMQVKVDSLPGKAMTKLEETAFNHIQQQPRDDYQSFIAGAIWLIEQANQIALDSMNETTAKKLPDMRAIELVRKLEELCEGEE